MLWHKGVLCTLYSFAGWRNSHQFYYHHQMENGPALELTQTCFTTWFAIENITNVSSEWQSSLQFPELLGHGEEDVSSRVVTSRQQFYGRGTLVIKPVYASRVTELLWPVKASTRHRLLSHGGWGTLTWWGRPSRIKGSSITNWSWRCSFPKFSISVVVWTKIPNKLLVFDLLFTKG